MRLFFDPPTRIARKWDSIRNMLQYRGRFGTGINPMIMRIGSNAIFTCHREREREREREAKNN